MKMVVSWDKIEYTVAIFLWFGSTVLLVSLYCLECSITESLHRRKSEKEGASYQGKIIGALDSVLHILFTHVR
jgi:hypothetical protein